MVRHTLIALLAALFLVSVGQAADKYEFDPVHSSIGFSVKHLVVSNVRGSFDKFTGVIRYDEDDITNSSVEVTIDATSISTNNDKRDAHLRSADFLEVETYPQITFKSKRIEKTGEGYRLVGDLSIKDVTKEVAFPFEVAGPIVDPWGNKRIGASATLFIDRQDFDVKYSQTLDNGGLVVGNEVQINLDVEAVKSKEKTD